MFNSDMFGIHNRILKSQNVSHDDRCKVKDEDSHWDH